MKARCKFTVTSVEPIKYAHAPGEIEVKLDTRYDENDPEDTRFSIHTPVGEMDFIVNNPNVVGMFEKDKTFYVDLIPVEEEGSL